MPLLIQNLGWKTLSSRCCQPRLTQESTFSFSPCFVRAPRGDEAAKLARPGPAQPLKKTDMQAVVRRDRFLPLGRRFVGFAALAVQLEALETRLANGEAIDVAEYAQLTSTLIRGVSRLGIERQARDVTPTLSEYLAQLKASEAEATTEAATETIDGSDG